MQKLGNYATVLEFCLSVHLIFGVGSLDRLQEEVKRLGARRAIVLLTPEQRYDAEEATRRLCDMAAGLYLQNPYYNPRPA